MASVAVVTRPPRPAVRPKPSSLASLSLRNRLPVTSTHFPDLATAVQKIKKGIPEVLSEPGGYKSVSVLLTYWDEVDLGVHSDADVLGEVLETDYGFTVEPYQIPWDNAPSNLAAKLLEQVSRLNNKPENNQKKLFIFYYAGHGDYGTESGGQWFPTKVGRRPDDPTISVRRVIKQNLQLAVCDVLIVLDCCHAAAIFDDDDLWPRRCEVLCASGVVEETHAATNNFTRALVDTLRSEEARQGLTATQLERRLSRTECMVRYGLKSTPRCIPLKSEVTTTSSVLVRPIHDDDASHCQPSNPEGDGRQPEAQPSSSSQPDTQRLLNITAETEARVVMVMRFKDPKTRPLPNEWLDWLRQRPGNIDGIELGLMSQAILEPIAMYLADSQLAIVSVPTWLWHSLIQYDEDFQYVTTVRSRNLLSPVISRGIATAERQMLRKLVVNPAPMTQLEVDAPEIPSPSTNPGILPRVGLGSGSGTLSRLPEAESLPYAPDVKGDLLIEEMYGPGLLAAAKDSSRGSDDGVNQPDPRIPEPRVSDELAERRRRTEMKELFEQLRDLLPQEPRSKPSKRELLSKSIAEHQRQADTIRDLQEIKDHAAVEKERLQRELRTMQDLGVRMEAASGPHENQKAPSKPTKLPQKAPSSSEHRPGSKLGPKKPSAWRKNKTAHPTDPGGIIERTNHRLDSLQCPRDLALEMKPAFRGLFFKGASYEETISAR